MSAYIVPQMSNAHFHSFTDQGSYWAAVFEIAGKGYWKFDEASLRQRVDDLKKLGFTSDEEDIVLARLETMNRLKVRWMSGPGWERAHAVNSSPRSTKPYSLCAIRPREGWVDGGGLPHCQACEQAVESHSSRIPTFAPEPGANVKAYFDVLAKIIALVAEVLGVSVGEALDLRAPAATGASSNGAPAADVPTDAGSKTNLRKKSRRRPIPRGKSGKSRPDSGSPSPDPSG